MSQPGSEPHKHTNRLIDATSPYLLQHAHNPVDWFPWSSEALERAANEDKVIFLSIGYSACHWCHVMERESFENEQIAALLNEHFVSIKVDREERPDLDDIYMKATMLTNQGQGGWPMSVFLTPQGKPFFAGTYFPPTSKWGRPGFADVLQAVVQAWHEDRENLTQSADRLTQAVGQLGQFAPAEAGIDRNQVSKAAETFAQAFDRKHGGILSGVSNKFPPSGSMSLMLREYDSLCQKGQEASTMLELVELTLVRMARGGIYDHLAGGFARYSTDPQWLVPHFEKMLYDQALISMIYLDAFQLTNKPFYAQVAAETLDYVLNELRCPEGGFYSAFDADSEGIEGKYYVWSKAEVIATLGSDEGEVFCSYYDVTESGNWEGVNILNAPRAPREVAEAHGISLEELDRILQRGRQALLAVRQNRIPPALDDKVLTGWNGLMISALARGGAILKEPRFTAAAAQAADFILNQLTQDGRLLRTWRQDKAHIPAFIDDYAFFVAALLDLYETTGQSQRLSEAERLNEQMIEQFWDTQAGGLFATSDRAEKLIVRYKESNDGAVPAGNSVASLNLLRLARMFGRDDLQAKAEHIFRLLAATVQQAPVGFDRLLAAVDFYHAPTDEIAIIGSNEAQRAELTAALYQSYDPNKVVLYLNPDDADAREWQARIPLLDGRTPTDGQTSAYVCRNQTCRPPVTEPGALLTLLQRE